MSEEEGLSVLKRAYLAVQTLQARVDELELARSEPLAVVGLAGRFPGAPDADAFWKVLRDGVDAIGELPADRRAPGADREAMQWGGFLPAVDTFDPQFFGISPREANGMDPHQRLFLEVAWEALENGGIAPDRLKGRSIGVYAGVCTDDYASMQTRGGDLDGLDLYYASGIAHSIVTGRVSYVLGLVGPCVTLDTACSSSLVAVHLACQAVRAGECEMAIAGGVNVILLPDNAIAFKRSGMMAADGRCKTFAASADGFVRSEGCGAVVVKRLSRALADGDLIHAVIRGSAVNQDGASSGLTAPSGPSQEAVIRTALRAARLTPGDVGYVEAHGTGTVLGDPIEVQAIAAALGEGRAPGGEVRIGSVKSNVGHMEAAAGIGGLIKVILSLQHRKLPASLHAATLNPLIPWERLPVRVVTAAEPWDQARIAGVSSFGFGGTNAHVIVSEAPSRETPAATGPERPRHVLALSAPTETAVRALALRYADHVQAHPDQALADVAHTANVGRAAFRNRAAIAFAPGDDVASRLRAFAAGEPSSGVVAGQAGANSDGPPVMFLFSGQGSQYAGMGRKLIETQPTFRRVLGECDAILSGELAPGILEILNAPAGAGALIDQTAYTQPVLFAFEYALAALWQSLGIKPAAVMGHSLGEYVAATVAGVLSLEDALRLVALRGRLSQALPSPGGMAAVRTDVDRARAVLAPLGDAISIAGVNAPESTVISGPTAALGAAAAAFKEAGIDFRPLPVSSAFHTRAVEPMLPEFEARASKIAFKNPEVPVYSNLFGRRAAAGEMSNASYWTKHLREPVLFAAGFGTAVADGFTTFLEIGPHPTLLGLGRQCFPDNPGAWLPSLRREHDDWTILLGSLAQLFVLGAPVDWAGFDRDYARRRLALPTYGFERRRHWITPRSAPASAGRRGPHPLLDRAIASPFVRERIFETELALGSRPWLSDHRVLGAAVLPTTAYLETAWAAAVAAHGTAVAALEEIDIHDALVIPEDQPCTFQIALSPPENGKTDGKVSFRIVSAIEPGAAPAPAWRSHASGTVAVGAGPQAAGVADLAALRARCNAPVVVSGLYQALSARGIDLGQRFHGLVDVARGTGEALGRIRAPEDLTPDLPGYRLHPALLDCALQIVTPALLDDAELARPGETFMPIAVERFAILAPATGELFGHAVARPRAANQSPIADIRLYDSAGAPVAEVIGLQLRRVAAAAWASTSPSADAVLYRTEWRAVNLPADARPGWSAPAPDELAARIAPSVGELAERHRIGAYQRLQPEIDALSRDLVVAALIGLGWTPAAGARVDGAALAEQLGVVPAHRRLFGRLLAILAEDGILSRDGDSWSVKRPLAAPPASAPRFEALRARFPEGAAELGLLAATAPQLAGCLSGRVDPLSLLFPGGRLDAADELYRRSPSALLLNALARRAVDEVVAASRGGKIRVLEIGAGTGGTTSFVAPALPPDRTEYLFTDISPLFLARAEERMSGDYPFLSYRTLDIERDPAAQGFASETFDLVIAANCLHATRDLAATMAHVRPLVRPGGALLMLEGTGPERWIDLTFGLTDGWWRFVDHALRPDYPLIDRKKWGEVLVATGFEPPSTVPPPGAGLEQNLLVAARAPGAGPARWVVLADGAGVGDALAAELRGAGHEPVLVRPGQAYARTPAGFALPPEDADAYRRLLAEVSGEGAVAGLVHLWSLDATPADDAPLDEVHAAFARGCRSALHLAQAAATCAATTASRLVLVTRGAQAVTGDDVAAPAHAALWGMAGTIRLEQPDLDCLCLDLDPRAATPPAGLAASLFQRGEPQLALRDGAWRAARLVRHRSEGPRPDAAVRLVNRTPGVLDGLAFVPAERRAPGAGEVEIRVTASAMNFRDVLIAMGLYPGAVEGEPLGGECAGEIVAVGPGVAGFAAGDAVVAMAPGGFGSHVIARAELVLRRPPGLTPEEAVTLPSAFMTAWHALHDLAALKPGERVLIHAGAGGVGLAAIQLAQRVGAEIFATAGSPEKRAFLTSLGVAHVMDSRAVRYADEIAAATGGAGVHVVLNSLADAHIERSLSTLAVGGRFVELGKRGIWTAEQVRARFGSARYFIVDLAATGTEQPAVVGAVLQKVMTALGDGEIRPLPSTVFAADDVAGAFRHMAQAKHIGKIVVRRSAARSAPTVKADGSYLVTGGVGGLGIVTARWLVERGAGHVVLMSRRAPDEAARAAIAAIAGDGARVSVVTGDVSSEADVARVLGHITAGLPPLRGIFHSAGALKDGVLIGQEWGTFAVPFHAKVDGTWHLHRSTRTQPLDFFVLYSSISALFGSPGQANHAAANAFMDALAHQRRARGLPALSINWGAWEEVGAAVEHQVAGRIAAQGVGTIAPALGIASLERLIESDAVQAAVMPADWSQFAAQFGRGHLRASFLAELATERVAVAGRLATPAKLAAPAAPAAAASAGSIRDAAPHARWELLLSRMRALAARVLGVDRPEALDVGRPLQEVGLDSLMAVELRNLMKSELGLERAPAATTVFDYPTVQALTDFVGTQMFSWPPRNAAAPARGAAASAPAGDLLADLEKLSAEDAARLLQTRLGGGATGE